MGAFCLWLQLGHPLLSTHGAAPGAPYPVLAPQEQEGCGHTAESPTEGHEDAGRPGAALPGGEQAALPPAC